MWATFSSSLRAICMGCMAARLRHRKPRVCARVDFVFGSCFPFAIPKLAGLSSNITSPVSALDPANELRAANSIVQANMKQLHITLSALFYIRGHCLLATAICPIEGSRCDVKSSLGRTCSPLPLTLSLSTLVYGSCDAGKTVHNSGEPLLPLPHTTLGAMQTPALLNPLLSL